MNRLQENLVVAICKQLVDLMAGNIGVESIENKGSTFWFTGKFDKQKASKTEEQESFPNLNHSKVLIVDHSRNSARFIVRQLEYSYSNYGSKTDLLFGLIRWNLRKIF